MGDNMNVQMEVSLYPLETKELLPPIKAFNDALRKEGFKVEVGPLSSYITGESEKLFPALGRAFDNIAQQHRCVLITKIARLNPLQT